MTQHIPLGTFSHVKPYQAAACTQKEAYEVEYAGKIYGTLDKTLPSATHAGSPDGGCQDNYLPLPGGAILAPDTPAIVTNIVAAHEWGTHVMVLDSGNSYNVDWPGYNPGEYHSANMLSILGSTYAASACSRRILYERECTISATTTTAATTATTAAMSAEDDSIYDDGSGESMPSPTTPTDNRDNSTGGGGGSSFDSNTTMAMCTCWDSAKGEGPTCSEFTNEKTCNGNGKVLPSGACLCDDPDVGTGKYIYIYIYIYYPSQTEEKNALP